MQREVDTKQVIFHSNIITLKLIKLKDDSVLLENVSLPRNTLMLSTKIPQKITSTLTMLGVFFLAFSSFFLFK